MPDVKHMFQVELIAHEIVRPKRFSVSLEIEATTEAEAQELAKAQMESKNPPEQWAEILEDYAEDGCLDVTLEIVSAKVEQEWDEG